MTTADIFNPACLCDRVQQAINAGATIEEAFMEAKQAISLAYDILHGPDFAALVVSLSEINAPTA